MQRLRMLFYMVVYSIVRGTLLSSLCWAAGLGLAFAIGYTFFSSSAVGLGGILFAPVIGVFMGLVIGAILGVCTGTITGLAAATMTSLLPFPLQHPIGYKQLVQIVCTALALVCTFFVATRFYFNSDGNPLAFASIPVSAFVAFRLSRYLASWAITHSLPSA